MILHHFHLSLLAQRPYLIEFEAAPKEVKLEQKCRIDLLYNDFFLSYFSPVWTFAGFVLYCPKTLCCHVKNEHWNTYMYIFNKNVHTQKIIDLQTRHKLFLSHQFILRQVLWEKNADTNPTNIEGQGRHISNPCRWTSFNTKSLCTTSQTYCLPCASNSCWCMNLLAAAPCSTRPLRTRPSVSRRRRPPRGRSWGSLTSLSRFNIGTCMYTVQHIY